MSPLVALIRFLHGTYRQILSGSGPTASDWVMNLVLVDPLVGVLNYPSILWAWFSLCSTRAHGDWHDPLIGPLAAEVSLVSSYCWCSSSSANSDYWFSFASSPSSSLCLTSFSSSSLVDWYLHCYYLPTKRCWKRYLPSAMDWSYIVQFSYRFEWASALNLCPSGFVVWQVESGRIFLWWY